MKYTSFETERLLIQPTSESDAEFILELLNTPKWLRYIGDRNVKTLEQAKAYIKEKIIPQFERLGYSSYTIITKQDHKKIGTCGLYDREGLEGIDIGFAFLPQYEKKGFGLESSSKLMEVAFDKFNISTLSAITTKDNFSSQKLLEKLGLQFIEAIKMAHDDEELLLYKIEI